MLRFHHALAPSRALSRFALLAAGLGAFLSGCGFARFEPREPWRAEAEIACMKSGLIRESQYIRSTKPIDGPGPCGTDLPLKVSAFQNDQQSVAMALASTGASGAGFATGLVEMTVIKPEVTMGCPMVAWTDDWIATAVQPAAIAWFGQGIKEIRTAGAYACRRRNHQANARLSEHAFGNAIDIMSFVFNDGNVVTVKGGWRGTEQEQGFLRDVFHGACQRFKTVLGPGSDALHYDHFHLDLARHDSRGQRRYCKPQVAAPQRPAPGTFGPGANPWGGPQSQHAFRSDPAQQQTLPQGQPGQSLQGQLAAGPRPAPPIAGAGLPPQSPGMLQAPVRPSSSAPRSTDSQGAEYELEPDFDPSQFDLATGSIPDLPPRRMPGLPPARAKSQPDARSSADLPPPRGEPVDAEEPAPVMEAPPPVVRPKPRAAAPTRNPVSMSSPRGN